MTDDRTGRDLVPRPDEPSSAVTPREPNVPASVPADERFSAGDQAHTVGLSEERVAGIVKQSGNARMYAFLAALFLVLFIPIYWLYDIGLPVIGDSGRLANEASQQQVTDISKGYALFLANCARCHGNNGEGGVGPPLNDQAKLFNAVTAQGDPGNGHLNPNYILNVLTVGGRYVCGDPNSVMPIWAQPNGPLNYLQIQQIIDWITASSSTSFVYQPAVPEGQAGATAPPAVTVHGWRDPSYSPAPDATAVPACWRGTAGGAIALGAVARAGGEPGHGPEPARHPGRGHGQRRWVDRRRQARRSARSRSCPARRSSSRSRPTRWPTTSTSEPLLTCPPRPSTTTCLAWTPSRAIRRTSSIRFRAIRPVSSSRAQFRATTRRCMSTSSLSAARRRRLQPPGRPSRLHRRGRLHPLRRRASPAASAAPSAAPSTAPAS